MGDTNYWHRLPLKQMGRRRLLGTSAKGIGGLAAFALVGCGSDESGGTDVGSTAGTPTTSAPSAPAGPTYPTAEQFNSMSLEELRAATHPDLLKDLPGQVAALQNGPDFGGVYRYSRSAPSVGFDPMGSAAFSLAVDPGTHNSLVTFKFNGDFGPHGETIIEPDLPEHFEYADDQTLVFRLRSEPIYWHDIPPVNGRQFDAEDLVQGIEVLKAAQIQGPLYRDIESMDTPDDNTFVLKFSRPAAYFLNTSATPYQWLVAREQVESSDGLKSWLIGTGAFQLSEAEENVGITYVRNPKYFKKDPIYGTGKNLPFLDRIEGTYLPDLASYNAAWAAGQVDFGSSANMTRREVVSLLEARPDAVIHIAPAAPSYFPLIAINTHTPPLDDERVRRALSMAIDREAINQGIVGGLAAPAYGQDWNFFDRPENPWPWTYEELGPYFQYNPEEAQSLLRAAGFDKGIGRPLELAWSTSTAGFNHTVWEAMADFLRQIGIDVQIAQPPDYPSYAQKLYGVGYKDLIVATPMPAWDADAYSYEQLHSQSTANYYSVKDSIIDELAEKQQTEMDLDARRAIVKQIMDRDIDQMYRLWGLTCYKFTVRDPRIFNLGDHYLAWMTPGWGERKLELAWKQA